MGTPRIRKVFVANKSSSIDYSKAEPYGELVPVTRGYIDFDDIQKISMDVNKVLFDATATDLLILSGHNLVSLIVGWMWIKKFGRVLVLHFDTKTEDYKIIPMADISIPVLL